MAGTKPQTVICTYKVKPGKGPEFEAMLEKHWPTLREAGLVTNDPPLIYRGLPSEKNGGRHRADGVYVEIFAWRNAAAPGVAHQSVQVMAVWEPMGALCEGMDFPHFEPLALVRA